jgi:hypothetical protein
MKKRDLRLVALLQAVGLGFYIALVSYFIWNAERWIGKMNSFWGPLLLLSLFSFSALICALITFGYAARLFWDEKRVKRALKLVLYTAGWLGAFVLLLIALLIIT